MIKGLGAIVLSVILCPNNGRIHRRPFGPRYLHLASTKLVPNPAGTTAQLDQVEQSIRTWPDGGLAVTGQAVVPTIAPVTAGSSGSSGSDSVHIDSLDATLQQIQNQANADQAAQAGSNSMNSMVIDLIRLNVSRLERDVKANISRIQSIINDVGEAASNGVGATIQGFRDDIDAIRAQLNMGPSASSGGASDTSTRIANLGATVAAIDQRIAALERRTTGDSSDQHAQSAEALNADPSLVGTLSLQFAMKSWAGRFGILGTALGAVALGIAIYLLTQMPTKPKSDEPEEAAGEGEEQVLLEAGEGGEEVTEEQAAEGDYTQGQEQQ